MEATVCSIRVPEGDFLFITVVVLMVCWILLAESQEQED